MKASEFFPSAVGQAAFFRMKALRDFPSARGIILRAASAYLKAFGVVPSAAIGQAAFLRMKASVVFPSALEESRWWAASEVLKAWWKFPSTTY